MKRYLGCGLVALAGLLVTGCPIYPNGDECFDNFDCPSGQYCNDNNLCVRPPGTAGSGGGTAGSGGTLSGKACDEPDDCGPNETCGTDGTCHPGDCYFSGCVDGWECVLDGYQYVCIPVGGTGGGGGSGGTGGGGGSAGSGGQDGGTGGIAGAAGNAGSAGAAGDAAAPVYCGNPGDCGPGQVCSDEGICEDGTCAQFGCVHGWVCDGGGDGGAPECVPENSASCILDGDCAALGAGYKCLSGVCTAPADQCTDKTQCPSPDAQSCVDGKCVASCTTSGDCPDGYSCDTNLGICTVPSIGCTITNDCGDAALVCVAGACVPKCGPGGACSPGYVCVANGCVPDDKPEFVCGTEGVQDVCITGSICLHHSCYITCVASPDSCAVNPPDLDTCKSVSTTTGQYNVCGSSSNLGNECDPTAGVDCVAGKICIDGFCR